MNVNTRPEDQPAAPAPQESDASLTRASTAPGLPHGPGQPPPTAPSASLAAVSPAAQSPDLAPTSHEAGADHSAQSARGHEGGEAPDPHDQRPPDSQYNGMPGGLFDLFRAVYTKFKAIIGKLIAMLPSSSAGFQNHATQKLRAAGDTAANQPQRSKQLNEAHAQGYARETVVPPLQQEFVLATETRPQYRVNPDGTPVVPRPHQMADARPSRERKLVQSLQVRGEELPRRTLRRAPLSISQPPRLRR